MSSALLIHDAATTPSQGRKPLVGAAPARGMTLIELLVTIVILVTVLAAVLPAISPNNDARKIREASRQLTSLFAQATAQAARDGRPVGVGFEDPDGDGIAIEAFLISAPPPYTGLASYSKARLRFENGDVTAVQFVVDGPYIADPTVDPDNCYTLDPIPPNVIRFGDFFEVGGFRFVLNDKDLDGDGTDDTNPVPRQGDLYSHTNPRALFGCEYRGPGVFVPRAAGTSIRRKGLILRRETVGRAPSAMRSTAAPAPPSGPAAAPPPRCSFRAAWGSTCLPQASSRSSIPNRSPITFTNTVSPPCSRRDSRS